MTALPRPFHRLLAAATTSNLGDGLVLVGAPLLALGLTREPALIGGIQAAFTLPWLVFALTAGALADRRGRRGLLVGAAGARGVVLLVVGTAAVAGHLSLPLLYLAVVLLGCGEVLFDTTSQSLLPDVVAREQLGSANGRLIGVQTVLRNFAGAPLAGVLVGVAGAAVLLTPAILYLATAALLVGLPSAYRPLPRPAARLRVDVREGLDHLLGNPTLRAMALLGGALNLANAAYFGIFVLFVVGEDAPMGLPAAAYGALAAALAAGSVVGSLVAGRLERHLGPRRTLIGGVLVCSAAMCVPLVTAGVAPIAAMALVLGAASVASNVVSVSSRQRIVPTALLGRVNASFRLVGMGAMPLGALLGGVLASATSLRTTFAAAVAVQFLAVLVLHRPITDRALDPVEAAPADEEAAPAHAAVPGAVSRATPPARPGRPLR